jgi:hypothetical protein
MYTVSLDMASEVKYQAKCNYGIYVTGHRKCLPGLGTNIYVDMVFIDIEHVSWDMVTICQVHM